jgi:hypothetical protein
VFLVGSLLRHHKLEKKNFVIVVSFVARTVLVAQAAGTSWRHRNVGRNRNSHKFVAAAVPAV